MKALIGPLCEGCANARPDGTCAKYHDREVVGATCFDYCEPPAPSCALSDAELSQN